MSASAGRPYAVGPSVVAPPTPDALIAGLRAGDAGAFAAIFRTYYTRLCGVVQAHVRSRAVAEEVVQELFLRLWRNRDQLEIDDLQAYLLRASRNAALTHVRRRGLERNWEARVAAGPVRLAASAEELVLEDALQQAAERAIAELPERCRLIYTMSRVQGLTYVEIAAALDVSPKTVETQMMRALRRLREKLSAYLP